MSLRARLVAALGVLLVAGLGVFGVTTYALYARSQYQRLDDQLVSSLPIVTRQLTEAAGLSGEPSRPADSGGRGGGPPPVVAPAGTYAELQDSTGTVVASLQASTTDAQPEVPQPLPAEGTVVTVGSASGSGQWRLTTSVTDRPSGYTVVAAVPTTGVSASLRRLVLIEGAAGLVLLVLLTGGSWLVLRRGLRPLETMAASARSISEGDLSHRVQPADRRSEVGQLGLALNTMLDEIEDAFRDRDATEQRLRQFLADASHELRTPLTSIQGFAELARLRGDTAGDDVALRRIEEESARMRTLVEDLLLLARLDQTRPVERRPVDLAVLAADACTDAAATDRSRAIALDAPAATVVPGDRDHLRQAVANLVSNALQHTPPGTPVEVRVRAGEGTASLAVRDHGAGLDDESLAHVFDRFWRADPSRAGKGAGLGLAIVQGIADEHGGTVTAANAPGGGAVFTLTLPSA